MDFNKKIDCYFWQYGRALRHAISKAAFPYEISEIDQGAAVPPPAGRDASKPLLVFTAADTGYLLKYGQAFVGSLVKHVQSPRLHVHLYNPAPSSLALLKSFRAGYPTLDLSWTVEDFDQKAFEKGRAKAWPQPWLGLYICCTRFLVARSIQRTLNIPVLILDVDVLFNGDVARRFSKGAEYALMRRAKKCSLSKRTLGGVVYASNSSRGRLFLDQICDHVARFLGSKSYWYCFDQYALYKAFRHMQSRENLSGFSELTSKDVSLNLAPDAMILYPKGKAKDEDEFAQRTSEYVV